MRFVLGLDVLPNLSVILSTLRTREKPTWYATSMHESTVFTVEFSCYSSQIMNISVIDEWFTSPIAFLNSINIPTQSPAEPRRLKIGLKLFKSSIVLAILVSRERKSLPYAYDYILIGNLHHVKKDEMHTSAMIQSCNPEIVEVNSALKFSEVSWVHQKRLRQRPTHIFFPSGIQRPSVSIDRRLWY